MLCNNIGVSVLLNYGKCIHELSQNQPWRWPCVGTPYLALNIIRTYLKRFWKLLLQRIEKTKCVSLQRTCRWSLTVNPIFIVCRSAVIVIRKLKPYPLCSWYLVNPHQHFGTIRFQGTFKLESNTTIPCFTRSAVGSACDGCTPNVLIDLICNRLRSTIPVQLRCKYATVLFVSDRKRRIDTILIFDGLKGVEDIWTFLLNSS